MLSFHFIGKSETCVNPKKKVGHNKKQQTINFKRKSTSEADPTPAKKQVVVVNSPPKTPPDIRKEIVGIDFSIQEKKINEEKTDCDSPVNHDIESVDEKAKGNEEVAHSYPDDRADSDSPGLHKLDNNTCSICHDEDLPPASRARKVIWYDCDVCEIWAHSYCASKHWTNIRKNSWLCQTHSA